MSKVKTGNEYLIDQSKRFKCFQAPVLRETKMSICLISSCVP